MNHNDFYDDLLYVGNQIEENEDPLYGGTPSQYKENPGCSLLLGICLGIILILIYHFGWITF